MNCEHVSVNGRVTQLSLIIVDYTQWNVCVGRKRCIVALQWLKVLLEEQINVLVNLSAAFHFVLDLSWPVCSRMFFFHNYLLDIYVLLRLLK